MRSGVLLNAIFSRLLEHYGPQQWWPAESAFEVMVGAVLTQNTSWGNVEKAIANLRRVGLLNLAGMSGLPRALLAEYIRPAGYFNVKADRLANLFALLNGEFGGDLQAFLGQETGTLREQLLSVRGIGPETADSILLYAAQRPVFVVDAYTFRVLARHGLELDDCSYAQLQELFMDELTQDVQLYNEYHALLVRVGKEFCKKGVPRCTGCPLEGV